jgi:hypothetical protein
MADLPIQMVHNPVFVSASLSGGDTYDNNGAEFLLLVLADVRTITITSPYVERTDYSIVYSQQSIIAPRFDPLWWNDPVTGRIHFEFNDPTGVQVAAVRSTIIASDPNAAPLSGLF